NSHGERLSPYVHLQLRALVCQFRRDEAHADADAERGRVTTARDCTDALRLAEDVAVAAHDAAAGRLQVHQLARRPPLLQPHQSVSPDEIGAVISYAVFCLKKKKRVCSLTEVIATHYHAPLEPQRLSSSKPGRLDTNI